MQWFRGLDPSYFHHLHSNIQSEITCTHNYPQFSPSWCPSAAGSSWPPPPWSPPWQSPPCPALSLPSTPSSSQPWCSQQAPNPSEFKITFVRAVCIRLPPTFLLAFCRTSPSQQYDLRHLCAKKKYLPHNTKTFRIRDLRSTFVPTRMIGVVSGACCLFWRKR